MNYKAEGGYSYIAAIDFKVAYLAVSERLLQACKQVDPSWELVEHFLVILEALQIAKSQRLGDCYTGHKTTSTGLDTHPIA